MEGGGRSGRRRWQEWKKEGEKEWKEVAGGWKEGGTHQT
jgi:hypothetical protein